MPVVYFTATFGDVPMLISSIDTERGRDINPQSPAQGDIHTLTDQGKKLRRATAEILFVDQPGQEPYDDRYRDLVKLFEDGEVRIFSHPLDGSYPARVENLSTSADSGALEIRVTATFLHEQTVKPVIEPAAGVNTGAGVDAVSIAADRTIDILDEFELETVVPETVKAEATRWSEVDPLDTQDVFLGVASMTQQIDEAIVTMQLASNLDRWEAFREMTLLRYALVQCAEAFTSTAETVIDVFIDVPRPVLAICAELYGAELARDRAAQVVTLNRLRTPGRVPAGTTLKMPSPGVA